ncbi:SyrP protein [Gammaproteobacteria bacterium LSUCC0112]|nr:SyrP protein [Gammaproteobacteria bacterium LSUCC0112]
MIEVDVSTTSNNAAPAIGTLAVEGQQFHPQAFPLVYAMSADSVADLSSVTGWIHANLQSLQRELAEHGAILFRGFPLKTDLDFDAFIQMFGLKNFTYTDSLSNAVRRNRTERVFTANEAPANIAIYLHHEMAQTPIYPSALFFFCEQPATSGGATPLCRSDVLLTQIEAVLPTFVQACEQKGVRYTNTMPDQEDLQSGQGRSWRSTLNALDKAAAEAKLHSLGYQWHWLPEDNLRVTTPVLPAVRTLEDGRRVFFNQLIAAFQGWQDKRNVAQKSICFGDGSVIDPQAMAIVIELSEQLSFDMQWQAGDVALVDNSLVMHGRKPFSGERRVLASLLA